MATTARGVPYPTPSSPNAVPADMQALATWVNDRPGVAALTSGQRDALSGQELWNGRVILNTTTSRLERFDASANAWRDAVILEHGRLTGLGADDHPQYLNNARGDARYPATSLLTSAGDLYVRSSTGTVTRLPISPGFGLALMSDPASNARMSWQRPGVEYVDAGTREVSYGAGVGGGLGTVQGPAAIRAGSILRMRMWGRFGTYTVNTGAPTLTVAYGSGTVTHVVNDSSNQNFTLDVEVSHSSATGARIFSTVETQSWIDHEALAVTWATGNAVSVTKAQTGDAAVTRYGYTAENVHGEVR